MESPSVVVLCSLDASVFGGFEAGMRREWDLELELNCHTGSVSRPGFPRTWNDGAEMSVE